MNETEERCRINSVVESYGRVCVGDSYDGRIGRFDVAEYGEYDNDIERQFTCQVFDSKGKQFTINKVELTIESGVGQDEILYKDYINNII